MIYALNHHNFLLFCYRYVSSTFEAFWMALSRLPYSQR